MMSAMPRQPWTPPESHATAHHPNEQPPRQVIRLPPPSSLAMGAELYANHGLPHGQERPAKYELCPPAYTRMSPLPSPTSEPHVPAREPCRLAREPYTSSLGVPPRMPPASSRTSHEGRADPRFYQFGGVHQPSLASYAQPQVRQYQGPPPHQRQEPPRLQHPEPPLNRTHPMYSNQWPQTQQSPVPQTRHSFPSSHRASPPKAASRAPERMKIAELLSDPTEAEGKSRVESKAPVTPIRSTYKVIVRQQPVAARSCGFGERDRRVVDPPPIVQVVVDDPNASEEEIASRIRQPSLVMHCVIMNDGGDKEVTAMPEDYRQQRRLMGTTVSPPFVGLDDMNREGCFFAFPDLSCRTPGTFRLKFSLVALDTRNMTPGSRHPVNAMVTSDVFTVYNAKDFPGMQASTKLTKRLKDQGCLISIKKGNERGSNRARGNSSSEDEDEADGSGSAASRKKRQKRRHA